MLCHFSHWTGLFALLGCCVQVTSEHRTNEISSQALSDERVADGSSVGRSCAGFLSTFEALHCRPAG